MRIFTYIAADYDHDKDAVNYLHYMKMKRIIYYSDAHELQQSHDTSLLCSIKRSLKYRIDRSFKFVLIVGSHTATITKGGCQLCGSYNSYGKFCARGNSVDYQSFIEYECNEAVKADMQIVVLYKSITMNRDLCPMAVRNVGTHQVMLKQHMGQLVWDNQAIIQVLGAGL